MINKDYTITNYSGQGILLIEKGRGKVKRKKELGKDVDNNLISEVPKVSSLWNIWKDI